VIAAASRWSVHAVVRADRIDLDDLAMAVRRRAGLEDDDFAIATDIAVALVGRRNLIVDPELAGSTYFRCIGGEYQIVLRLDAPDVRFRVTHEAAHVALRAIAEVQLAPADEERAANYLAAAILAPRDLVKNAHTHFGERPRRMAKLFGLSQTAMVLRLAEVLEDERAVVTRSGNVLFRSSGGLQWSDIPAVDIARGEVCWKGLAKAQLRGGIDEGRVALRKR
jgi:hypothetical protein